jgi:DNA polymerase-3 subunit gamma/tau
MAYVALYRKYRSQNFDELMGQDQVTTTLQNAIRTGRIAHAYLFHGARGCGKTSTARLLSRALNCVAQDGPSPNPCGVCRMCVSIRENTCMDVVEIDAASETGVDNVREKIIENVQYASSEARYKVYIIDEVHDLSAKAFDALLKTLEEPPPHVVFILATTEYHKVPITIRSRCQGYQFKRGSIHDLSAAVERVIKAEGFMAEPEAIQAVARSAEGSWRDALSILEQVLAYSDGHITADIVHRALGTVGTEMLARVTETLAHGAWAETLGIASDLVDSGTDVRQLLTALAGHLRDLMLLATGAKQAAAQELGADRLNLLKPQSNLFDPATLLDMMGELSAAEREIRFSNQHRWILERTLCRLMMIGQGTYTDATQPRTFSRPQDIAAKALPKAATRQAATSDDEDSGTTAAPYTAPTAPPVVPRPPTQQEAQAFATATNAPTATGPMDDEDAEEEDEEDSALEIESELPLSPPIVFSSMSVDSANGAYVNNAIVPDSALSNGSGTTSSNSRAVPPPAPSTPNTSKHQFADGVTFEVIQRAWPRILKLIEKEGPAGIPWLKQAAVTGLEGNSVMLTFQDVFARDRINKPKGKELIERKLNEALQTQGYRIQCLLIGQIEGGAGAAVKTPLEPSANGTGATAIMEMSVLLDTPSVSITPSGPSRVMDFEVPAALPPAVRDTPPPVRETPTNANPAGNPPAKSSTNGANGHTAVPEFTDGDSGPATPIPDESQGMLKEVLDIFGGQVINTENI